ncbi:hypothetical protein JTE90_005322 [Oedothorax gibbosus]|uniref:Uncharacterized protein n=1 Tax=Oedothorax gibbosus TaxID=931172 RepID=A0AAV6UJB1_9ARAC|nr:hypothetical protein JTE90_005322 [Oedothorax gibbosus]
MSVLHPNKTYYVPEGTQYLIITLKKCYFVVDKVLAGTEVDGVIPFNENLDYVQETYDVPPPTPPNDWNKRSGIKRHKRLPDMELHSRDEFF